MIRRTFAPLAVVILTIAAAVSHAQTTSFTINQTPCGVYSIPQRCFGLSVTTLDAGNNPTGPSGSVTLNFYAPGYPAGYSGRTVKDYGYVQFNGDLDGLAGQFNPPYPYQYAAAITAVDPNGDLLFQGVNDLGVSYHGRMSYTFSTHYACSGGRGGCHTSWTITGGLITATRVDD